MGIPEERKGRNRRNIWNSDWKISQINVGYQTKDPRSSENTKQDKCQKKRNKNKDYAKAYHFKLKKMKDKEKKPERSQRKICLMYRGAKLRITSHFSEII